MIENGGVSAGFWGPALLIAVSAALITGLLQLWIRAIARDVYREESGQKAREWEAEDRRLASLDALTREKAP